MSDEPKCALCGEPMPEGEEMFKYHGYSGDCPKPPLPRPVKPTYEELEARLRALERPGVWVQRDKLERAQFLMSVHAVATLDDIHDAHAASLYEVKEILNALLAAREER